MNIKLSTFTTVYETESYTLSCNVTDRSVQLDVAHTDEDEELIQSAVYLLNAGEARALAHWLLSAADEVEKADG